MNIYSKIGTYTVTLSINKPNIKLINYMTMNHAPLTPDLFPYYAGTWTEDSNSHETEMIYEDWIENERYQRLAQEVNEDGTLIIGHGNEPFNDMEAVSKINDQQKINPMETIVHNTLSQEVLDEYKKQREHDLELLNLMDDKQHEEIVNKFSDVHHQEAVQLANTLNKEAEQQDPHVTNFNDLNPSKPTCEAKQNVEPIINTKPELNIKPAPTINEPKSDLNLEKKEASVIETNPTVNNEIKEPKLDTVNPTTENKQEAISATIPVTNAVNKLEDIKELNASISDLDLNLPDIGHKPVFVTKAKNKDEYYDAVLEEYNNLLKNS